MMAFDALEDVGDDALMVLYSNGDMAAARSLALRHLPRLVAQANRLLRDPAEAEDVAQEAMLRLWKVAPDWRRGEAKVSTWLYRVVANLCTDRLRKRRGTGLDSIPEPQRVAVMLRHIDELPNPEIAEVMGLSVEAVESLTARGKRNLAAILAGR